MQFKLFDKKGSQTPPSTPSTRGDSPKMLPATPKMKLGTFLSKTPNTPTLADGSLRGEQKRTHILEQQLKDVSVTASKAYDKVEDLQMQNSMLEEQVNQQKELIYSFTRQLEEVNNEKKSFKEIQERHMMEKLKERTQGSEELAHLKHQNEILSKENQKLKSDIAQLFEENNRNNALKAANENKYKIQLGQVEKEMQRLKLQLQQSKSEYTPLKKDSRAGSISNEDLAALKAKVESLEKVLEEKTHSYEKTILGLKKSLLVLTDNNAFLTHKEHATSGSVNKYTSLKNEDLDEGGDTFILSNISFVR